MSSSVVESTEYESETVVNSDPDYSDFGIGGLALTNVLLIGCVIFLILIFTRSKK